MNLVGQATHLEPTTPPKLFFVPHAHAVWSAPAHVGRRDIACFLIERGARLDVFAAAMLGDLSTVRALLEAQPALREAKGPHGIELLAHAEAGGENAKPVVALLQGRQPVAN